MALLSPQKDVKMAWFWVEVLVLLLFLSPCAKLFNFAEAFQISNRGIRKLTRTYPGFVPVPVLGRLCADSSSSSRGFGKTKAYVPHQQLEVTRPNEYREVQGRFSKFLAKRCENFEKMKTQDNFPVACDLYARLGGTSTFWFVGKLIHHPDSMVFEHALSIELPVIIEYSKALRPKELASPMATISNQDLQIWYARGNSEMDVAQNKVSLKRFVPLLVDDYSHVLVPHVEDLIGFEPEIYQGGESGFRCVRDEDGHPVKAAFEVSFKDHK